MKQEKFITLITNVRTNSNNHFIVKILDYSLFITLYNRKFNVFTKIVEA